MTEAESVYEIRALVSADRVAWEPLWDGYRIFYKEATDPDLTEANWKRFLDPAQPMFALGAFQGHELLGIVHYLFHRTTGSASDSCYLQDLFTAPEARGKGVGRALIQAVVERAQAAGAARVYWHTHETNTTARLLYDQVAALSGFVQYRIPFD